MLNKLTCLFLVVLGCTVAWCQTGPPKLIDCHVHHNGRVEFLQKLVQKLEPVQGMAMLITEPKDLDQVVNFMKLHPHRLIGLGQISLDAPDVLQTVDRFHTGIVNRTTPEIAADISSDRMRVSTLDLIARRFPKLTIIGAHLGNPDYAWAAEIARWNPNLYFDVSGSTLLKKQEDYTFFKSIFWWTSVASPHTPKSSGTAFEKLVFGSDVFQGEFGEFDGELERYHQMLDRCGVSAEAQANIFGGTLWRILSH
jgi:uncharacterized protein